MGKDSLAQLEVGRHGEILMGALTEPGARSEDSRADAAAVDDRVLAHHFLRCRPRQAPVPRS